MTPLDALRTRVGLVERPRWASVLPPRVIAAIGDSAVDVFLVDDDASDTERFVARHGVALDDCANTLVLKFRRDGIDQHAAVVSLGGRRLDVNGAVKAALGAQRLTFAKRETTVELTGMEPGGVTAFGLPDGWTVLVDAAVMDRTSVVMGAGVRRAKLLLAPQLLRGLSGVVIASMTPGP